MAGWLPLFTPELTFPATFQGNPNVTITAIDTSGGIISSRDSDAFTAQGPYPVHVAASAITATGTSRPFEDLEFSWKVTGPEGGDTFTRPTDGVIVNSFTDQVAPEAAFFFRTAGTYTVRLIIRGKNGGSYTTASVTKNFTFIDFSANTTYFLDSAASGTGTGLSEDNAFTTTAALNTAINASSFTSLLIRIAKGSDFTGQIGIEFNSGGTRNYTGVRINTYGSGARPILDSVSGISLNLTRSVSSSNTGDLYDVVVQGLDLRNTGSNNACVLNVTATGTPLNPIEHIYFDDCLMSITYDGHSVYAPIVNLEPSNLETGAAMHKFGFWNCDITNPQTTTKVASAISGSPDDWFFVYGCLFEGAGVNDFDHHIYPEGHDHGLYKWNTFGQSGTSLADTNQRGFGLNLNWQTKNFAPGTNVTAYRQVISENNFYGTQQAIDAGNRTGNFSADDSTTDFRSMVIEKNAMHDLEAGAMQLPCLATGTIRLNRAWNIPGSFFGPPTTGQVSPYSTQEMLAAYVYGNRVHRDSTAFEAVLYYSTSGFDLAQQWTDNIFADFRTSAVVLLANFDDFVASSSTIDRNQLWAPNSTNIITDNTDGAMTYATFRSNYPGFNASGSNTSPGWASTVTVWSDLD
jgi:hypothetical protein